MSPSNRLSMKTPTIEDVADAAGVGKASVSRYLNNHPNISDATRAKIEAALKKTGYKKDPLVSQFLSGVRRQKNESIRTVIGWINTKAREDHWRREKSSLPLYDGVRQRAEESKFGFEEFWTQATGLPPKRLQNILVARGIKALIVPPDSNALEALPGFDWSPFAVVTINPSARENYQWHSVGTDGTKDAITMFTKLRKAGYERIGLVLQRSFSARDGHGMLGRLMVEPLIQDQPDPIRPFVYGGDLVSGETGINFRKWLKQKPDVIICLDNRAKTIVEEEGFRVPQDIGLAHILINEDTRGWTGLSRNTAEKGRAAVDLLTMQLSQNQYGIPDEPRQILISDNWVQGKTTRK